MTFRLADSLPASQLAALEEKKRDWVKRHPEPWDDAVRSEWNSEIHDTIDKWLDAGHGACLLADERCRKIVEEAIEYFDANRDGQDARRPSASADGQDARRPGETGATGVPPVGGASSSTGPTGVPPVGKVSRSRYRLHSYIVMPNHVHVLFELFDGADLSKILHSWKSFSAKRINETLGEDGQIWREEYFDRLIRSAEHYENVIGYFHKNEAVARALARGHRGDANCDGQDARRPSGSADGQDARRPSGSADGQDARRPSGSADGQDARRPGATGPTGVSPVGTCDTPRIIPSLRMNAGDEVSLATLERFAAAGCRVVDISVDDDAKLDRDFESLSAVVAFAASHGWTMLLHLGALRETSERLRRAAGPAGGFAGMRRPVDPAAVARFLNRLELAVCDGQDARRPSVSADGQDARRPSASADGQDARRPGGLPRTVLMTLNPEAHAQLAILSGSFVEDGIPGKVQLGPAWWWCDHKEGILDVFEKNAAYSVLSTFIGMTTDSRSLLSFVRHDYFRRLLADWMARKVATGDFPDDESLLRPICENICYRNAAERVGL